MSGHRSLGLIRKSGSTSRILNLHLVQQNHGTTEDYAAQPLFQNRHLNGSMILKHTLRGSEQYLFDNKKTIATKVVLPFARAELEIGGTNVFVGQKNFESALRGLVPGYRGDDKINKDVELLLILDTLPSFDPFLLREKLNQCGRKVARCYFQISDADLANMQDYVSRQINTLIEKAFTGAMDKKQALDFASQMASKILSDENTESLAPLKSTLGLNGQEWTEGVFSWKGFLYYKWMFASLISNAKQTLNSIQNLNLARCDSGSVRTINVMRERAISMLRARTKTVAGLLGFYDNAFKALTEEGKPTAFREFLLQSPGMFIEIGENVGVVSHISSYWTFKFSSVESLALEGPELIEALQEIEGCSNANNSVKATEMVW